MPTMSEIKAEFAEYVDYLNFDEGRGEYADKAIIKGKRWFEDKDYDALCAIAERLGGIYDRAITAFLVPLAPSGPRAQGTGIPSLDAKVREIEEAKKGLGLVGGTGQPVKTGTSVEKEAEQSIVEEIVLVEVDKIMLNKYNSNEMSEEEFNALVENLRREGPHGTSPIEVRSIKGGGS